MPDLEHTTERTHLIPHLAHNRRFSAVQQEVDADSLRSTHVSKEEQRLAATSIGERLPYNSYTTIDWLHDLVSYTAMSRNLALIIHRSKTLFALGPSIHSVVYAVRLPRSSSPVKDGLPPH